MAVYRIVNSFHATSGLPEDDVVNTFHFRTAEASHSAATGSTLNGHVAACYEAVHTDGVSGSVSQYISGEIARTPKPTVKAYNPLGGSPLAVDTWAAFVAAGGNSLPAEVACCLSFRGDLTDVPEEAVDDADPDSAPERPASRMRGRIYVGPLSFTASTTGTGVSRPITAFQNALKYMAQRLYTTSSLTGGAANAEWGIWSNAGLSASFTPVADAWVDDAWDSQRRRGRVATSRTFASI